CAAPLSKAAPTLKLDPRDVWSCPARGKLLTPDRTDDVELMPRRHTSHRDLSECSQVGRGRSAVGRWTRDSGPSRLAARGSDQSRPSGPAGAIGRVMYDSESTGGISAGTLQTGLPSRRAVAAPVPCRAKA